MSSLALTGATVFVDPDDAALRDGIVLIRDGTIAAVGSRQSLQVPPNIPSINCSGYAITAGLWNSHVHFTERKWAGAQDIPTAELVRQFQDMLTRYGFTSVFDLSSLWENTRRLRGRIESGEVPGPAIRSTGEGLVPPGALPPQAIIDYMGWMKVPLPEVADATQAAAAARKLVEAGVDAVKLFASGPRGAALAEGVFEAVAREAHATHKLVFVHPNSGADVLAAVRGGADIVAHTTPHSGPWEENLLALMQERGVALTPTLTIWKWYARHDRSSTQDRIADTAVGQLRAWLKRGGTVLFGTDLGAIDYDPAEEYRLMAAAGMSFRQILASLTTAPAARFGASNRVGRVSAGQQADLAVFRADPSNDLRALTTVRYTLREGRIIYTAPD